MSRSHRSDGTTGESVGASAGFAALAIGVAAALVPLRDELGSANAALLLVMIVVAAAAVSGRVGGVVTGVVASLAFNFFYTKPYLTLRIHSGRDVVTTVLIVVLGLAVGELGVARSRQSATRRSHLRSMRSLETIGALVSAGASSDEVWQEVRRGLVETLAVLDARFEVDEANAHLPLIERDGRVDFHDKKYLGEGFALPAIGATLNVEADGVRLGRIVLAPDPSAGVTRVQRRTAVAMADQLAIALRGRQQSQSTS